jgi:hypothetical protein
MGGVWTATTRSGRCTPRTSTPSWATPCAAHLWEGLEPREIAEVLGLTTVVVRPRLSRARARLRDLLGNDPEPPGHSPDMDSTLTRKERS